MEVAQRVIRQSRVSRYHHLEIFTSDPERASRSALQCHLTNRPSATDPDKTDATASIGVVNLAVPIFSRIFHQKDVPVPTSNLEELRREVRVHRASGRITRRLE